MPLPKRFPLKGFYQKGDTRSRHAEEEFGPARKEIVICPHGEAVYYKKSWHHFSRFFTKPLKHEKQFRFKSCPVHALLARGQYEGEIVLSGVPPAFRREVVGLVENIGEEAFRRDVLDRILALTAHRDTVRITTSENQTASRIAAKIAERFKKRTRVEIHRGKSGDVVRVTVAFVSP